MGKPLLTDEVIEKAKRGESFEADEYADFDTKIMPLPDHENQNVSIRVGASKMLDGVNCNQIELDSYCSDYSYRSFSLCCLLPITR